MGLTDVCGSWLSIPEWKSHNGRIFKIPVRSYLGNRKYAKKMYLLEKPGFSKQIRFLINLAPKAHLGSLDIICILWLPKPMRHAASP
jgi:hypothetical protein